MTRKKQEKIFRVARKPRKKHRRKCSGALLRDGKLGTIMTLFLMSTEIKLI